MDVGVLEDHVLISDIFVWKVDIVFLEEDRAQPVVSTVQNVSTVVLRGTAMVLYMKFYQMSSLSSPQRNVPLRVS